MKFLIDMNDEQEKVVRKIAFQWGFVLDRSQRRGEGKVAAMLRAVGDGKMVIIPASPNWKNGNE